MRALLCLLPLCALAAEPQLNLQNSPRFEKLLRAGNLYLTLDDAIALAIENNLDVELQRATPLVAAADLQRTRAGGAARGLPFTLQEAPTGVGGLSSQLLTGSTRTIPGSSVSTNPFETGALGAVQSNLAITGSIPLSSGPAVPNFDPYISGRFNYAHQSTLQTNPIIFGLSDLVTDNVTAGAGLRQGFGSGAQVSMTFDNLRTLTNSPRTSYSPFTTASLGLNVTQPLLRGFGFKINRRYQSIAANQVKVADLVFRQQLINTVYGVTRLFHDLTALAEDVKVKEESLRLAQRLIDDTRVQVEEGTQARVELARANAQLFSARLDLERARGSLEEQEAILKNVLTRRGGADPAVRNARLIALPGDAAPPDESRPEDQLFEIAAKNRPDLSLAELQIANSEISLEGARNALKPQLDITAFALNNALAGQANPIGTPPDAAFIGGYGLALAQIFRRNYPVYGGGLTFDLPVRNRLAEADLARDQIQLRQTRIRRQQLINQVRLEIEDALIALRRARAAYEAATQARAYQEESLAAEQAKFEAGASTSYLVIQFQTLVAQSKSTEAAARAAWRKALAAVRRSTASILDDYQINVEAALQGSR
jgi:outer membrane protein TolC